MRVTVETNVEISVRESKAIFGAVHGRAIELPLTVGEVERD
jgi:hypothetical protein